MPKPYTTLDYVRTGADSYRTSICRTTPLGQRIEVKTLVTGFYDDHDAFMDGVRRRSRLHDYTEAKKGDTIHLVLNGL